ncbi:hypothetical protein [Nonomuraea wenchangensis]|uniref:hypothetical protein n=1 Tax=Nonomuraea wenchangensis TaxID=568860 RepID=UPI00332CE2AA
MLRRLLVSASLAGTVLVAPVAASAPAHAAVQAHASASCYKRSGNHWNCITPGAYCPKEARGKYGYAKVTKKRYRCSQYTSSTWRWKRA